MRVSRVLTTRSRYLVYEWVRLPGGERRRYHFTVEDHPTPTAPEVASRLADDLQLLRESIVAKEVRVEERVSIAVDLVESPAPFSSESLYPPLKAVLAFDPTLECTIVFRDGKWAATIALPRNSDSRSWTNASGVEDHEGKHTTHPLAVVFADLVRIYVGRLPPSKTDVRRCLEDDWSYLTSNCTRYLLVHPKEGSIITLRQAMGWVQNHRLALPFEALYVYPSEVAQVRPSPPLCNFVHVEVQSIRRRARRPTSQATADESGASSDAEGTRPREAEKCIFCVTYNGDTFESVHMLDRKLPLGGRKRYRSGQLVVFMKRPSGEPFPMMVDISQWALAGRIC